MRGSSAIELTQIGKKYELAHKRESIIHRVWEKSFPHEIFWCLRDISLTIQKGDKIGILGPNGAGKTTLLKIIAGITKPTEGSVVTCGKIVSLMNLDAGFHPDLTGKENIFLNGILAGMSRSQITHEYNRIIAFSGIGRFIDSPYYTYSNGMKFRLAFSIAVVSKCDILLMDEVMMVGDADFQEKTFQAIRKLQKNRNVTTIVTSHLAALTLAFADIFYQLKDGVLIKTSKTDMNDLFRLQDRQWRKRTDLLRSHI